MRLSPCTQTGEEAPRPAAAPSMAPAGIDRPNLQLAVCGQWQKKNQIQARQRCQCRRDPRDGAGHNASGYAESASGSSHSDSLFERRTRLGEANCALQTSRRVARLLFRIMVLDMFVLLRAFLHCHLALLRASPFTE